jgi:1-acyl-sn-glycerol-3-phosphate acyltransferase
MLAKQELFRLPIFSAAMRGLRCIPIDRDNVRQSLTSLRKAAHQIRSGNSIVVFPEGTRSADGSLQELKTGPFYLAEMARVPIVPVAIVGTRRALAKASLLVHSAPVEVRIGAPILPDKRGPTERERLRHAVRAALEELCGDEVRRGHPAVSTPANDATVDKSVAATEAINVNLTARA